MADLTVSEPSRSLNRQLWLPDFCTLGSLFPLILLAELVALIVVLAPAPLTAHAHYALSVRIGPAFLFTLWVALLCASCLCLLKQVLRRLGPAKGGAAALLLVLLVSWGCASAAVAVAPLLDLAPLAPTGFQWRVASLSMLVAAAALRYGYIHQQWKQQVQANARAELEALQARIRPHFLFNTLNAIASLIRSAPAKAEDAVLDLSDLLRAALKAGSSLIPVHDELELAQRYLAIEKLRLGERVQVSIKLADLPESLMLPPLSLQPLVENAVLHGIAQLPAGGCIEIWSEIIPGDVVRLCIRNPRPSGASDTEPSPADGAAMSGHGMALDNVRARLKSALGDRAELQVSPGAGSFLVCIHIPQRS